MCWKQISILRKISVKSFYFLARIFLSCKCDPLNNYWRQEMTYCLQFLPFLLRRQCLVTRGVWFTECKINSSVTIACPAHEHRIKRWMWECKIGEVGSGGCVAGKERQRHPRPWTRWRRLSFARLMSAWGYYDSDMTERSVRRGLWRERICLRR